MPWSASVRSAWAGDIPKRLAAVRAFSALPEAAALAAANKRVGNILKKVENPVEPTVDSALLKGSRRDRAARCAGRGRAAGRCRLRHRRLRRIADRPGRLAPRSMPSSTASWSMPTIPALRANRLGLLAKLHAAMNQVADLSKLSA